MVEKKGTAIMVVYTDVAVEHDADFNAWYNQEHLPERLSNPGFLDGPRYEALRGGPRYLAVYELESAEALQSDEYLRQRANPTDWSKRVSPLMAAGGMVRNVYTQIYPAKATRIRWAVEWRPRSRSDAWTCRRRSRTSTTTTTITCGRRAT